jgi:tetratricopeptide (TPR) repeat protein
MRIEMSLRRAITIALLCGGAGIAAYAASNHERTNAPTPATLAVTTKSDAAREAYEMGMKDREDLLYIEQGLDYFRLAVKADPHFALGHSALAYFTTDPNEEKRELELAAKNLSHASPDEKLLIRWLNGTKDGQLVPAIAAMNDLLAKYPNDKRLANLSAEWLCSGQQNWERGEEILQKVLKNDPAYYPALNNLAYCYSLSGRVNLAPALMERYVRLLPDQPNPEDSYGELLRMAGDYDGAITHYRAALRIDSKFTTSQLGIASTLALMGDEENARPEYLKAIEMTSDRATKLNYRMLWALTYYRENQPETARKNFAELAQQAREQDLAIQEAEAYRTMALFNTDAAAALTDIDAAKGTLSEKHVLSPEERDTELATIEQTRAFIAARANRLDSAEKALETLKTLAGSSRNNLIQIAFHSGNGAVLFLEGKYADSISELQYDARNPLSLALLADVQTKAGAAADAKATLEALTAIIDERVETAFAVPQARVALKAASSAAASAPSEQPASAQYSGHRGGPL